MREIKMNETIKKSLIQNHEKINIYIEFLNNLMASIIVL